MQTWQSHGSVGTVASISKWVTSEFPMSHTTANNIDRKLMIVSMSIICCQPLFSNMTATFYVLLFNYLTNAARNKATCVFDSAVLVD